MKEGDVVGLWPTLLHRASWRLRDAREKHEKIEAAKRMPDHHTHQYFIISNATASKFLF